MEENDHMVNYGICQGVFKEITKKKFVLSHFYDDRNEHFPQSDGLCSECFKVAEKFRAQRKINKLEEKLNGEKIFTYMYYI